MGFGRFSDSEKIELLNHDLKAISDYLGNKKYFFGENIQMIDTIIFAVLVQIEKSTVTPQLGPVLDQYPNLKTYIKNIIVTIWPEFN